MKTRLFCFVLIILNQGIHIARAASTSYSYDSLNRLTGVAYPDGTTIAYTYDSAGNRLSQAISNSSIPLPKVSVDKSALTFSAAAGQAASSQTVTVGNVGGGSLQWVASPTAPWLSVTPGSGTNSGTVNVTASAAGMPAGTYNANIAILASAANAPLSIPVILTVTGAQGNPLVSSGGIVSAAGSSPGIARGSVASIYGTALADLPASATTVPLPLAMVNVQVSVNGLKAPLWYVGPGQINFQVPFEAPLQGQASVIVSRDGVASAPSNVTLTPYAPSIFMYQRTANSLDPIIVHAANNQLVTPGSPAVAGEYLTVYGTGIGDLNVLPVTGALSPENPVATATLTPTATIGGVKAPVTFAGLTPDAVGLAQFNIQVPGNLPAGPSLPMVIAFGSAASQPVNLSVQFNPPAAGTITAMAGNGTAGFTGDGGVATSSELSQPTKMAGDAAGNIYILDALNNRVRKVDANGIITTFAGNGISGLSGDGGPAVNASLALGGNPFLNPGGLAVDAKGNVFISDFYNHRVRKVTPNGIITTVAGSGPVGYPGSYSGDGGAAINATLDEPEGIAFDAAGNLFISDWGNHRVRRVDASGTITTVAGNGLYQIGVQNLGDGGLATNAILATPVDVVIDRLGNLYIADYSNSAVRKVDTAGIITRIAGNGSITSYGGDGGLAINAGLYGPGSLALDGNGNVYVADRGNARIRMITPAGLISTVAGGATAGSGGDGGPATSAQLNNPNGVWVTPSGNLLIGDTGNNRVRAVMAITSGGN